MTDQFAVGTLSGSLVIEKRTLTLASAGGEKAYDGLALTRNELSNITVGGEGFAEGEGASYAITGSQTLPGSSENTFSYILNEGTDAGNYDIEVRTGSLTVNPRSVKYDIRVEANSASFLYDGTEHKVSGLKNDKFTVDGTESWLTTLGSDYTDYAFSTIGLSKYPWWSNNDVSFSHAHAISNISVNHNVHSRGVYLLQGPFAE